MVKPYRRVTILHEPGFVIESGGHGAQHRQGGFVAPQGRSQAGGQASCRMVTDTSGLPPPIARL